MTLSQPPADPEWLAHRYDPVRDAVHFRHVPRARHREVTFLTDEELGPGEPMPVARPRALAEAAPAAPLHLILHSAYCCSTLLARALDREDVAVALKEPVILNDLVGWRHRGGDNARVAEVLDGALTLLARPFAPNEAVIVKPSNVINVFAPLMLAMRPGARALLLHAPLPAFIGSIAAKGMWGRLWVRELMVKQLKDGLIDLGFTPEDHLGQTDLQVAAVGWLAQQALFAKIIARHGPDRVRSLDSETLLARPAEALAALARHFRLTLKRTAIDDIVAGPIFGRHSKFGTAYDASARAAAQRDAADVHGEELAKVVVWAEAVAKTAGVPLDLAARLIE